MNPTGLLTPQSTWILHNPGKFALQVLKAFRANQGLLLAGAVAYYTLLSIVPLMVLMAALLLLGAQVIAEYERLEKGGGETAPQRMRTEAVAPER